MSSRGRLLWLWLCFFAFLKSWEKTDFSNATTAVSQSNYFHSNPRALPLTNQIASCKHPERVRWTLVWFSKCRRSWSLQQVILLKVDISTVRFSGWSSFVKARITKLKGTGFMFSSIWPEMSDWAQNWSGNCSQRSELRVILPQTSAEPLCLQPRSLNQTKRAENKNIMLTWTRRWAFIFLTAPQMCDNISVQPRKCNSSQSAGEPIQSL